MTTPDLEQQWHTALWLEDCVELMHLLEVDSRLLKVGSKVDPLRDKWGILREPSSDRPKPDDDDKYKWKGITALHVGALKGCVDLIKQVLLLCDLKEVSNYYIEYEQTEADLVSTPGQSALAGSNAQNIAADDVLPDDDAPAHGDQQSGRDRGKAGHNSGSPRAGLRVKFQKAVSSILASNRRGHGKSKEKAHLGTAQRSLASLEEKEIMAKEMTPEESAGDFDSLEQPADSRVAEDDAGDLHTISGISFSRGDLKELISAKHGRYGLDALEMAALRNNIDIIALLLYAYSQCGLFEGNPTLSPKIADTKDRADSHNRGRLRLVTAQFMKDWNDRAGVCLLQEYSDYSDFNFLPIEEYLFHYLCVHTYGRNKALRLSLWEEIKSSPDSLWRFVLELQDGQGRPPFHVATDWGTVAEFMECITDKDDAILICALTAPDSAGRTPLYRTATMGSSTALETILRYSEKLKDISATIHPTWRHPCGSIMIKYLRFPHWRESTYAQPSMSGMFSKWDGIPGFLAGLSRSRGLREYADNYNPVQAAIVHRNYETAKLLIRKSIEQGWSDIWYFNERRAPFPGQREYFGNTNTDVIGWGLIEFACLVRADLEFVQFLLKECLAPYKRMKKKLGTEDPSQNVYQAVHVVASIGDYEMLKAFIDDEECNLFVEDFEGNTTLHHAMKVRKFEFGIHFLDYSPNIDDNHLGGLNFKSKGEKNTCEADRLAERKGCINLLLQAGCDVSKVNHKKQTPYPQGDLNKAEFLSWWHEKQEKEFLATQNNLNFASNAISVTAALVATASYVGPLQPPMGYTADTNQIQDNNLWVILFIVCDTSAFYLAIASIVLSLLPSLPMPQQSMMLELRRTRRMVTLAVSVLFPSVVCVFLAFGCSSFAVISANIVSSTAGNLTIATTCVEGLGCLLAFFLFLVRLVAFLFPQNKYVRVIYRYLS